jgi:hypothetical protein
LNLCPFTRPQLCAALGPLQQTVLTPHVYPPSITKASFLGTSLWDQCRTSFGYLQTRGYCPGDGSGCRRFPVLIGEVGSAFETDEDKAWMDDFADFMNAEVGQQWGCVAPAPRVLTPGHWSPAAARSSR